MKNINLLKQKKISQVVIWRYLNLKLQDVDYPQKSLQRGHFVQYTEILQYSSVFGNLGFSIPVFPVFENFLQYFSISEIYMIQYFQYFLNYNNNFCKNKMIFKQMIT